ncbi:hypothetical protein JKP88DRAFT_252462 [Tribonema minus]|uniref:Uncharacterized protein n=1 Tax=Tribonema minus TaxID=303371 RepID=A0A836CLW8_9STRA|nr:hypothetical protein JKP88DRAFT_252462 [Tribonema minus]
MEGLQRRSSFQDALRLPTEFIVRYIRSKREAALLLRLGTAAMDLDTLIQYLATFIDQHRSTRTAVCLVRAARDARIDALQPILWQAAAANAAGLRELKIRIELCLTELEACQGLLAQSIEHNEEMALELAAEGVRPLAAQKGVLAAVERQAGAHSGKRCCATLPRAALSRRRGRASSAQSAAAAPAPSRAARVCHDDACWRVGAPQAAPRAHHRRRRQTSALPHCRRPHCDSCRVASPAVSSAQRQQGERRRRAAATVGARMRGTGGAARAELLMALAKAAHLCARRPPLFAAAGERLLSCSICGKLGSGCIAMRAGCAHLPLLLGGPSKYCCCFLLQVSQMAVMPVFADHQPFSQAYASTNHCMSTAQARCPAAVPRPLRQRIISVQAHLGPECSPYTLGLCSRPASVSAHLYCAVWLLMFAAHASLNSRFMACSCLMEGAAMRAASLTVIVLLHGAVVLSTVIVLPHGAIVLSPQNDRLAAWQLTSRQMALKVNGSAATHQHPPLLAACPAV